MDIESKNLYYCDIMSSINSAVFHRCRHDWSWDTAATDWTDTDLWYIAGGWGRLETPHGSFLLQRGMLFFLNGGVRYIGSHRPERPLQVYAVHFEPGSDTIPCFSVRVKDPEFLEKICLRIVESCDGGSRFQAEHWLAAALQEARSSLHAAGTGLSANGKKVLRIKEQLREREDKNIRVEDLARWFGSSRAHFSRIFKQETGRTPREYLVDRRIDRAASLLTATDYRLSRIAEITGYSDLYFFSRQFKEKTGLCPSAYRKEGKPARRG